MSDDDGRRGPSDEGAVAPAGAWVDRVSGRSPTYVVRCRVHGDPAARTWGSYCLTIMQGAGAAADARRYADDHNAAHHAEPERSG